MNWSTHLNNLINNLINLVSLTWPPTIIILVLIFKKNIARLLERINKVSKEGISFDHGEKQITPPTTIDEAKAKVDQISQSHKFSTISQSIVGITEYINKSTDDKQKIETLTKELAETFFYLRCQAVYNSIFGSQIGLLKIINNNKPNGLHNNQIENYFNNVVLKYPDFFATWTCKMYLNFLQQSILIIKREDNFFITDFGVDFLIWLQWTGFTENKLL